MIRDPLGICTTNALIPLTNSGHKSAPRHDVNDPLRRALGRYPARATGVVHVMAW